MKKIFYIIISIYLVGCSDQDLNDNIADNFLYNLNLSSDNISVGPIDANHSVKITTNTEWSAESSEDWILLENTMGNGNSDLTFKIKANPLAQERTGTIGIYCFGKHKKDIKICQGRVSLVVSSGTLSFTSHRAEQSISFRTEGKWTISTPFDWIKVSQNEGFGDASLLLSVEELMSIKNREGYITIKDQSSQVKRITIIQKGKYLSADINQISFLASGENVKNINILTDGFIEYACDSWIICNVYNNSSISVRTTDNNSGLSKNGILLVSLKGVSDFEPITIQIYQAPVKTTAQMIDLGLSVKWASYNIGATNEDEVGGYYLCGEGPDTDFKWFETLPDIPSCVTGTIYDTANAYWGGSWRMPTEDEWYELINNTSIEKVKLKKGQTVTLINEITGEEKKMRLTNAFKFIAKNGNYIIIPIAGAYYYRNPEVIGEGYPEYLLYWPSWFLYRTAEQRCQIKYWDSDGKFRTDVVDRPKHFIPCRAVWNE